MGAIPYGCCHCGCGEKTTVARYTDIHFGYVEGEPKRYVYRHYARTQEIEPKWIKEDRGYSTPCWIWQLSTTSDGYGLTWDRPRGKRVVAHRKIWEVEHGPVPAGMQLHHKCSQRACVNLCHLVVVRPAENAQKRKDGKLTMADAREIRRIGSEYPHGRKPRTALARQYGVSSAMIDNVLKGRAWRGP